MTFQVEFDPTKAIARLDRMIAYLGTREKRLDNTYLDWQANDLNRKRPRTDVSANTVATSIFNRGGPRILMTKTKRAKVLRAAKAKYRRRQKMSPWKPAKARTRKVRASRPILRPFLLEKLRDRMRNVLFSIKWQ